MRNRAVFLKDYDISLVPLDRMRRRDGGLTEAPPESLAQQILDN